MADEERKIDKETNQREINKEEEEEEKRLDEKLGQTRKLNREKAQIEEEK